MALQNVRRLIQERRTSFLMMSHVKILQMPERTLNKNNAQPAFARSNLRF